MKSVIAKNPQVQIGDKFGRLEVIGVPFVIRRKRQWRKQVVCECECGTVRVVPVGDLLTMNTRSCGCWKRDLTKARLTTHGNTSKRQVTTLYWLWANIKQRCTKQHGPDYELYAGRGIRVCEEWSESFEAFRDWAITNGYAKGLQIDRKDNDGNYEPGNCRFVTPEVNSNNRRSNRFITAFGETKTIANWSRDPRCICSMDRLKARIYKGWPPEVALTHPISPGKRPVFQ